MKTTPTKKARAEEVLDEGETHLRDMAFSAGQKVRSFFSDGQDKITEYSTVAKDTIRDKPIQSGLAAFAAGIAVALLMRRR